MAHLADTVESRIYKDGFDLMISQMGQSEFSIERLVPAVDRLLKSAQASAVTEDTLSDATIDAVFGPNELLRFKIPDSEFASPPQVTRSDSGQDVIVTATQSEIALSQPGEFGSNGIIKAPQNEPSVLSLASLSLKHFISFAGDPFIAVGDTRNFKTTLYSATNGDAQPVIFPVSKPWALLRLE